MDIPTVPMLAAPVPDWTLGPGTVAEPKWDGYRALAGHLDDGRPFINSRSGTSMTDGFPEIAAAVVEQLPPGSLVDGELVIWAQEGMRFERLGARLHTRPVGAARLAAIEPASLIVFDVLYLGGASMMGRPYRERRALLEEAFASGRCRPPLNLCPSTSDPATARRWLEDWTPTHIEGLVIKKAGSPYSPGRRGWKKWRIRSSEEAVVGAVTGSLASPSTALLGRWDGAGRLRYAGRTTQLPPVEARALAAVLRPPADPHPWEGWRFSSHWGSREALVVQLVEPEAVAEVSVDASRVAGGGWRHGVRWVRLRPDLSPSDLPPAG